MKAVVVVSVELLTKTELVELLLFVVPFELVAVVVINGNIVVSSAFVNR